MATLHNDQSFCLIEGWLGLNIPVTGIVKRGLWNRGGWIVNYHQMRNWDRSNGLTGLGAIVTGIIE